MSINVLVSPTFSEANSWMEIRSVNNFCTLLIFNQILETVFKITPMRQYKEGGARRNANAETVEAREVTRSVSQPVPLINFLLTQLLDENKKRIRHDY